MERLTIMTPKGAALKMDDTYPDETTAREDLMRRYRIAVDRLAAYEDTGLMPEEIKEVQEAMAPIPFGRFHDIMEAECAGLLVLPSESNTPLTLEELREMDGEPVWVVGSNDEDVNGNGYAVVHIWHEEFAQVSWPGDAYEPEPLIENYGKTWLAYRRKPEEGTT